MSLVQVGVMVARGLAILILAKALPQLLSGVWNSSPSRMAIERPSPELAITNGLVLMALAAVLWWRAPSFGKWTGPQPEPLPGEVPLDRLSLGTGLIQAFGLYWVAAMVVELAKVSWQPRIFGSLPDLGEVAGDAVGLVGAIAATVCARPLSSWLSRR